MKNIGLCLGMMAFLMLTSCGKKEEKTTETTIENNTVIQDTVTVTDTVPAETDGTSVKVDSTGVDVKGKDVKVEIKK